ncbi:MAG: NEL-type E3 ubiquitin ligase domain-containing protein [Enterobacteriaceae bacterium]
MILDASNNSITLLPSQIPASLSIFHANGNQLNTVPEFYLHHDWSLLTLGDNPLRTLPDSLRSGLAHLDGVTLPGLNESPADALRHWLTAEDVNYWTKEILHEANAEHFLTFVRRLTKTASANDPNFVTQAGEWLQRLGRAENRALRALTFAMAQEAVTSCVDRVALAYNDLRMLELSDEVEKGLYDQKPEQLYTLAQGLFRLQQLEKISFAHVGRLRKAAVEQGRAANIAQVIERYLVDEIEVFLAYQTQLAAALKLPIEARDMTFFTVSRVTQEDLNQAKKEVEEYEQQLLASFINYEWTPWQRVLSRVFPREYAEALAKAEEILADVYQVEQRVSDYIRRHGLDEDEGTRINIGAGVVRREVITECMEPLSRQFYPQYCIAPGD